MPNLGALAKKYGYTTKYTASGRPSLPNFLAMAAGGTFGITDDAEPAAHRLTGATVFGQAIAKGLSAGVFAEDMPSACAPRSAGKYLVRYTAWPYFVDEAALCKKFDLPMGTTSGGAFATAIDSGKLPTVGVAIPNSCNAAHDAGCTLSRADGWLKKWLDKVFAGPDWRGGKLAVVVTFDEGTATDPNIPTVVMHPSISGKVVSTPLSHVSWSRSMSELSGSRPLRNAANATSLLPAFGCSLRQ
jgi:acid phosphatase